MTMAESVRAKLAREYYERDRYARVQAKTDATLQELENLIEQRDEMLGVLKEIDKPNILAQENTLEQRIEFAITKPAPQISSVFLACETNRDLIFALNELLDATSKEFGFLYSLEDAREKALRVIAQTEENSLGQQIIKLKLKARLHQMTIGGSNVRRTNED
jgi:cellobiose phosphorylase